MRIKSENLKRIVAAILISIGLTSCHHESNNKVGLLLHEMEGRWYTDVQYLQKYANEAGLELIIKDANGDENKQLQQADELIDEGVEALIIVVVNQNTAAGIVRDAQKEGVITIAYDRMIQNASLDFFITSDYVEIGKMQAEYATRKVPEGNYIVLWGDASDNNSRQMREGQEKVLKPYINNGSINLVYRAFISNWSVQCAKNIVQRVIDLSNKKIDVVLSSNDNMGLAALQVFDENGIEKPKIITGQDATDDACISIKEDGLSMTVYKPISSMAEEAIGLVTKIIHGEKNLGITGSVNNNRKDIPTLFVPAYIVDKTNIDEVVGQ